MTSAQLIQVLNELVSLLLAFVMGARALKYADTFFRLIFLQVLFWIFCYTLSYGLTTWQRTHGIPQNNQWLMNIHLAGETLLLLAAVYTRAKNNMQKALLISVSGIFLAVALIQALQHGVMSYLNYADVSACIILTVVYLIVLYNSLQKKSLRTQIPVILLSIGLIIYFACSVPLVALLHVTQKRDPESAAFLFSLISDVSANLRYLLTALAFWFIPRTHTIH